MCVCMCVCACVCACVYVCVCDKNNASHHTRISHIIIIHGSTPQWVHKDQFEVQQLQSKRKAGTGEILGYVVKGGRGNRKEGEKGGERGGERGGELGERGGERERVRERGERG